MVFPVFIVFVALTRLAILRWERSGARSLRNSFLFQLFMMLATVLCAWQAAPVVEASAPLTLLTGSLCAAAMAVQNTYGKLLLGKAAATTVMTGNVTTLVIELVDSLRGDAEAIGRCKKLTWPVLGFTAGCMSGGVAFVLAGFHGLLLPCAILAWLAAAAKD